MFRLILHGISTYIVTAFVPFCLFMAFSCALDMAYERPRSFYKRADLLSNCIKIIAPSGKGWVDLLATPYKTGVFLNLEYRLTMDTAPT